VEQRVVHLKNQRHAAHLKNLQRVERLINQKRLLQPAAVRVEPETNSTY
jgi:hypothetical protein